MNVQDVFQRLAVTLDRAGIAYMVTGSFASAYHGVPRATQDIDIVIEAAPDQLRTLIDLLPENEYYVDADAAMSARSHESLFNIVDLATGWKIDLIVRKSRPFSEEEFRRRRKINMSGVEVFVASAEDVIISKLEWSKLSQSSRQIEDAAAILRMRWESLDQTYLQKWIATLGLGINGMRPAVWQGLRKVSWIRSSSINANPIRPPCTFYLVRTDLRWQRFSVPPKGLQYP